MHAHFWRVFLFWRGSGLKYTKPPLTFKQQADQLLTRGLLADRDELISRLKSVNYYRLSGYWYPFRNPDNTFQSGTTLTTVWRRYTFDRCFRLLLLDAIERVEIAVRTELIYNLAHTYGAFAHEDPLRFPNLFSYEYENLLENIKKKRTKAEKLSSNIFKLNMAMIMTCCHYGWFVKS